MKKAPIFVLLTTTCLLTLAVAQWSRVPGIDKKPVNMSLATAGTSVSSSEGFTPAGALLLGDPTRPITLAGGRSNAIIKFVKQSFVESVSFVSDGLEGKVSASMSADGKAWNNSSAAVFAPADRFVNLSFGRAQGRYLRLEFELVRGGSIRSFQAFGSHSDGNYTVTQTPDGSGPMINFASGIGGGRLIYVNPELYSARNDAVKLNKIDFPESDEKYRTAVYDLGQVRSLSEFGSVHSPRPVRLAVYAFEALPEKEDWRGRLAFDPGVFDTTEPVASGEDSSGSGAIKVKSDKTVKARYIALRWEPDFNPPNFSGSPLLGGNANVGFQSGSVKVNNGEVTQNSDSDDNGGGTSEEMSEDGDGGQSNNMNSSNPQSSTNGVGSPGARGRPSASRNP